MPDDSRQGFLAELKRRNVHRVAFAYIVGAWALIQVADTIFPYFNVPDRAVTFVIVLAAIGLVPALIVAWVFEVTPEGIVRDDGPDAHPAPQRQGLRTFDYVVIGVLTVLVALFAFDQFGPGATPAEVTPVVAGEPSVAVLPFDNRSGNPDDVYFVDGIHNDIITSLSKIGALKVIARTSVEQLADSDMPIAEIAAELGVSAILEGGVQRAGDTVRISVTLIDVATEATNWVENYDRRLTTENIFAIQSEISQTVAANLQAVMTPDEESRIEARPTDNLEAYELYLLGNQRIRRLTGDSLREAADYFERAIELDPEFALAYVGLADSLNLTTQRTGENRADFTGPALAAAEKAIELDPQLGEAYASIGAIHHSKRTDENPEPFFVRAIELSPNYATAYAEYGQYLLSAPGGARAESAVEALERAIALDPISPRNNAWLGSAYWRTGRLEEAEQRRLRAIEIDPEFAYGYEQLAHHYSYLGRYDDAYLFNEEAIRLNPEDATAQVRKIYHLTHLGDFERAQQQLDEARAGFPHSGWMNYSQGTLDTAMGGERLEAAIEQSRRDIEAGTAGTIDIGMVASYLTREGDFEAALALSSRLIPTVKPGPGDINFRNYNWYALRAEILMKAGAADEANALIDQIFAFVESEWTLDVEDRAMAQDRLHSFLIRANLHAVRKDRDAALQTLRQAVDHGWLNFWFLYLYRGVLFDLLKDDPEFVAIQADVRERIDGQLAQLKAKLGDAY